MFVVLCDDVAEAWDRFRAHCPAWLRNRDRAAVIGASCVVVIVVSLFVVVVYAAYHTPAEARCYVLVATTSDKTVAEVWIVHEGVRYAPYAYDRAHYAKQARDEWPTTIASGYKNRWQSSPLHTSAADWDDYDRVLADGQSRVISTNDGLAALKRYSVPMRIWD